MFETHCHKCAFAKYTNNLQTGCVYNRIEKFINLGATVKLEEENGIRANVINTYCNHCIDSEFWETLNQRETALYNYTRIRNTFVVVDDKEEDYSTTYNKLLLSCNTALYSEIPPDAFIFLLINPERFKPEQLFHLFDLMSSIFNGTGIKYYSSMSPKVEAEDPKCVYLYKVRAKIMTAYYTIFNSGYNVGKYFNSQLNYVLNEELLPFLMMIGDEEDNCWVFNSKLVANLGWLENESVKQIILEDMAKIKDTYMQKLLINSKDYNFHAKPASSNNNNSQS